MKLICCEKELYIKEEKDNQIDIYVCPVCNKRFEVLIDNYEV